MANVRTNISIIQAKIKLQRKNSSIPVLTRAHFSIKYLAASGNRWGRKSACCTIFSLTFSFSSSFAISLNVASAAFTLVSFTLLIGFNDEENPAESIAVEIFPENRRETLALEKKNYWKTSKKIWERFTDILKNVVTKIVAKF